MNDQLNGRNWRYCTRRIYLVIPVTAVWPRVP